MDFYDVYDNLKDDAAYRFLTDRIQHTEPHNTFLQDRYTDVETWREENQRMVLEKLLYDPPKVPFNDEVLEEEAFDGYTRLKIAFDTAPGCRVPAYLLIPDHLKAPAPGLVVLHDHGAMFFWGKEKAVEHKSPNPVLQSYVGLYYEGLPLASQAAKRGYVTLVIDSLFFGERRFKAERKAEFSEILSRHTPGTEEYVSAFNDCAFKIESDVVKSFFYAGWTFMGVRTRDDMASVGYLAARPEVNAGRIGCAGLSMGGHRSGWLSAMDDRVRCAVMAGTMQRNKEMLKHRLPNVAWMWAVPGLYGLLDQDDIVSLSAPKPIMVMHGKQDWLYLPEQTGDKAIAHVRDVYQKAGAPERFAAEIYDVPHVSNREMQAKAFGWLDSYLKV